MAVRGWRVSYSGRLNHDDTTGTTEENLTAKDAKSAKEYGKFETEDKRR